VEGLEEHIIRGVEAIKDYYLAEGYQHYVANRLRPLGVEVRAAEVEGALILSYAYHDIAKAAEPYQSDVMRGRGAPGHEIVSARMTYIALWEGALRLPEPLAWACVKAVALHMGAMRESPDQSAIAALRILERANRDAFIMDEVVTSWFEDLLRRCWHINELPTPALPETEVVISREDLRRFVASCLSPRLRGSSEYTAEDLATLLLLHPIILADEIAVATNIGREPRRWAKDFTDGVREARKYRPVATGWGTSHRT